MLPFYAVLYFFTYLINDPVKSPKPKQPYSLSEERLLKMLLNLEVIKIFFLLSHVSFYLFGITMFFFLPRDGGGGVGFKKLLHQRLELPYLLSSGESSILCNK